MSGPILWKVWKRDYRQAWRVRIWSRRIRRLDDRMLHYVSAFARLQEARRGAEVGT